jgi:predicted N-acyltransferase
MPVSGHVRTARSIQEIGPGWEAVSQECSFYLSYPWLRTMEGALSSESYYLILHDGDGSPLAGVPCHFITDRESYRLYNLPELLLSPETLDTACSLLGGEEARRLEQLARSLRHNADDLYPVLTAVTPSGYISSICYRPGVRPEEKGRAAEELVGSVEQMASDRRAVTIAFLYIPAGSDPWLHQAVVSRGYVPVTLTGECLLPVRWTSFEGYLRSCSKSRRQSIVREMRKFREAGFAISQDGAEALTPRLATLQASVQRRHGHRIEVEQILGTYAKINEYLASFTRLFVARRSRDVTAFSLFYQTNQVFYARLVGLDYEQIEGTYAYFNVLFYEPIRAAIAEGSRLIHFGIESFEAKLARGCELRPLMGYVRFGPDHVGALAEYVALFDTSRRKLLSQASGQRRFSTRAEV